MASPRASQSAPAAKVPRLAEPRNFGGIESVTGSDGPDALLEAVVFAAERFLRSADWRAQLPTVLARLGGAAGVSRVYVFENQPNPDGGTASSQRFEWTAPGCTSQKDNPAMQNLHLRDAGLGRWDEVLPAGGFVHGRTAGFPESERALLASQDVLSLAVVPIFVEGAWWGFIGFDDCSDARDWSAASLGVLQAAAGLFGAAVERSRAQERLVEGERRFHLLTRATLEGVLIHDGARILDANPAVLAMMGYAAEEVIGRSPFDFLSPESREVAIRHARSGYSEPYEVIGLRSDGTRFPIELKGGTLSLDGEKARFVSVRDLTHRKRAEENERRLLIEQAARVAAEGAQARAQFLAEASRVLSSSFDSETTLARVARLAVPYLADYCVIDTYDGDRLRRVATAAADATQEAVVEQLKRYVPDLAWVDNPIVRAARTGEAVLVADAAAVPPEWVVRSAEHLELLRQLAPRAAMFVPVRGGGGVLGVLSLVATGPTRTFTAEDLAFAENLAGRTGLAIQNAQLFQQAQQASQARDEVLSVVAHDLRNPLGVIRNGAELLTDLGLEERQRRFTEMILRAADGMNRLISDLLEVTRIETGHLRLDPTPVRIGSLIEDSATMLRPLAEARRLVLDVELDAPAVVVELDGVRIHQVLSNLVGNAIKFTPPGGRVVIRCRCEPKEVRFAVIDTGPGISAEEIPHIFGRFWQASRHDQRGIGLGLAIAKGLVEAHGGRIWVESTPGEGAQFFFTIPFGSVSATLGATSAAPHPGRP
jgi:PAS domain S-box-containing protein